MLNDPVVILEFALQWSCGGQTWFSKMADYFLVTGALNVSVL